MTEKKMTIREGFEKARDHYAELGDTEMVEFFEGRIAQVEKKNSAVRKPTPKQIANDGIKGAIAEWAEGGVLYTAADIVKNCPACEGMSVQKVSALLRQLVADGTLTITEDKRKNFYSLAE